MVLVEEVAAGLASLLLRSGRERKDVVKATSRKANKDGAESSKPETSSGPTPPNLPSLQLGPNGKLVHLADLSQWVASPSYTSCSRKPASVAVYEVIMIKQKPIGVPKQGNWWDVCRD
jgi:hypothetical protein